MTEVAKDLDSSRALLDYLMPEGRTRPDRFDQFNSYLKSMGYRFDVGVVLTNSRYADVRLSLIQYARNKGVKL